MKKANQKFDLKLLTQTPSLTLNDTVRFLEDFRQTVGNVDSKTVMISIRIPKNILDAFRTKANLSHSPYQRKIIELMRESIKN